ncbi:hypothetical protein N7G274_001078 [Stereocaulon virgatum]|uniref:Uncharacterized protein n=1 Tax=Stereocaulon virgatum TaxID=373712 RepID=A0ABR4AQY5_9LECA
MSGRTASIIDDANFTRMNEYTRTLDLLRLLYNVLVRIVELWENFESGELQYFEVQENQALRKTWDSYIAGVNKNVTELRFLRRTLQQKIEIFDNKRSGLVNASAMVESRAATTQGRNIGRLTKVTVVSQDNSPLTMQGAVDSSKVYLPLSLGTAVFSMVILPKGASWVIYAVLVVSLLALTLAIAFRRDLIHLVRPLWHKGVRKESPCFP